MIRGRDYTERIKAYKTTEVVDAYGKKTTTFVLLGTYPAAVKVLSGTKALYYQERGIKHPVIIEMRAIADTITKIEWDSKVIYPSSIMDSKENKEFAGRDRGKFLTIEGSFAV